MQLTRHAIRDAVVKQVVGLLPARQTPAGNDILVIQPDHLGDIVLSQPALNLLRSRHPGTRIVAIVGPWSEAIARMAWPVDEIHTFPFPAFDRNRSASNPVEPYRMLGEAANLISEIQPARVYLLRPDDWWSAVAASIATQAPVITSSDLGPGIPVKLPDNRHSTERAATIAANGEDVDPGPLSLPLEPDHAGPAGEMLESQGIRRPYVVIHPGSGANVKLWPASRWRAVAQAVLDDGLEVVVTGSPTETDLANDVVDGLDRIVNLAGSTPLDVLIEVLRSANLVVGPDCGPLHLAVACGTPTVHLYGPSDPVRYGPWGDPDRHQIVSAGWSCPGCGNLSPERSAGCGCMLAIETQTVVSTIREMMKRHGYHQ